MSHRVEPGREDEFNACLASALEKGIELEGKEPLKNALGKFYSALEFKPNCAPVLECCAMVQFMLDDKSAARELIIQASRNKDGEVSEVAAGVHKLVRVEYMKWSMYQPMIGKQIEVKYTKTLPEMPPEYKRNCSESQVFKGAFFVKPTIQRVGDEVFVTMTLDHVEIGVTNFMTNLDCQGYFIYEYDMDISPSTLWKSSARLSTVRSLVAQSQQLVQQQQTTGYAAQVGIGGVANIPNINMTYKASEAISTFTRSELMTAIRAPGDENVMRSTWKVNTYEDGKAFVMGPVWKIRKLPYPPANHWFSTPFQGTWVVPLDVAIKLEYDFEWKIQLVAKFAMFPRTLKRECLQKRPSPLTYDYTPHFSVEMSDFSSASRARMFQH